jgi:carboxypeptidase T
MKFLFALLFSFLFLSPAYSQNYKQVKIYLHNRADIKFLHESGIGFDHAEYSKDNAIIIFVDDKQFSILKTSGFRYDILIDDWFKYYKERQKLSQAQQQNYLNESKNSYNVSHFGFGSMGGYYTLNEVIAQLDTMRMLYPNLISEKQSIVNTIEGRPMYVVKISDNPDVDEDEPRVLYTALHHAREPEGMMQLIYFMYYLLENYNTDPAVHYLVDNRELYFIPVVNPDGYEYNRQTNPDGGGFWRKNRRQIGSEYGVDLNRNYGPMAYWNSPNNGSSLTPGSQDYRGTAPFSEPETQNIRDFVAGKKIKNALNYHTFGDYLIYPYGALSKETPDSLIFRKFASDMTGLNNYSQGTDQETVGYSTRGNSDDYLYDGDVALNGGKIFAMTPEVGTAADGFWPPQSRIFPLVEENIAPNLYYAWVAGGYVSLENTNFSQKYFLPGDVVKFKATMKNIGLSEAKNISINLNTLSLYDEVNVNSALIDSIASGEDTTISIPFSFTISNEAQADQKIKLLLTSSVDGAEMSKDTIEIIVGLPEFAFEDTTNDPSQNWIVTSTSSDPKWEATTESYYSAPTSFTDSKNGNYADNATVTMTLKNFVDLSGFQNPQLRFWTKYDIENGWDYGQVKISTDDGVNWIPLAGQYTEGGAGSFQPGGEPVYSGTKLNWVLEDINLSAYSSKQIKLKFELKSDGFVNRDGWYVDDIAIVAYDILPVELTLFTANFSEGKVYINWSTATELNNNGFEIERGLVKDDGKENPDYKTIGFVKGKGNSEEISNYSFVDKFPGAGINYYRLKQIDFNGEEKLFGPVKVEYPGVTEYELAQNFPNPFNPSTKISFSIPKAGFVTLKVYNILGIEVATLVNNYLEAGRHSVDFSAESLKTEIGAGVYFYSLSAGDFRQTKKMVILK